MEATVDAAVRATGGGLESLRGGDCDAARCCIDGPLHDISEIITSHTSDDDDHTDGRNKGTMVMIMLCRSQGVRGERVVRSSPVFGDFGVGSGEGTQ